MSQCYFVVNILECLCSFKPVEKSWNQFLWLLTANFNRDIGYLEINILQMKAELISIVRTISCFCTSTLFGSLYAHVICPCRFKPVLYVEKNSLWSVSYIFDRHIHLWISLYLKWIPNFPVSSAQYIFVCLIVIWESRCS